MKKNLIHPVVKAVHKAIMASGDCQACQRWLPLTEGKCQACRPKTFSDWLATHRGIDKRSMWYLQNCLHVVLGFDHPKAQAATEYWKSLPEEKTGMAIVKP